VAIDLPHLGDESQQMDRFGLCERIEQPVGHDKTGGLSPGFCSRRSSATHLLILQILTLPIPIR
jgi:hypothetical protein